MKFVKHKRIKSLFLAMVFLISYLLSSGVFMKPLTAFAAVTGTVNDSPVNVRTGPGTSYSRITQLSNGAQVTILETVNTSDTYSWYKIGFNLSGTYTEGYIASPYVTINKNYTEDADFEAYMNAQGFPESYKSGLRQMHAQYPKWVFVADHISYNWSDVLAAESQTGRSLISGWSITSWKSMASDAYNAATGEWYSFDSGYWVAASQALVAYALDPRNFLNSTNVFMFEDLAYNSSLQTESGISAIINGSFMQSVGSVGDGTGLEYAGVDYSTYSSALIKAAQVSGVSPYHLATRIIQEMGISGASDSISGTTGSYPGYYNYYNWGAYASGGNSAITNGLLYAASPSGTMNQYNEDSILRPWNSRMRAIIGGAIKLGTSYIQKGQDTLYYQKFNVVYSPVYSHQYMTNVLAAKSESSISSAAYSDSMKASTGLVFSIPVYQNMPSGISEIPTGTQSSNNYLNSLSINNTGLTPTFSYTTQSYDVIVENDVTQLTVSAEPMASTASVSGAQTYGLNVGNNTINVVVTAENGEMRTYTINAVRKGNTNNNLASLGLSAGTLSPAFDPNVLEYTATVENPTTQVSVSAAAEASSSSVSGAGSHSLNVGNNQINITVTSESGSGKTYIINIVRNAAQNVETGGTMSPGSFKVAETNSTISGVNPGSSSSDVLNGISVTGSYSKKIVNAGGAEKSGNIGTGDRLIVTDGAGNTVYDYTFVIYGDVNGDGVISSMDLLYVKRHILGASSLQGAFAIAGDANRGGDSVTSMDMLYIKRAILGAVSIVQ